MISKEFGDHGDFLEFTGAGAEFAAEQPIEEGDVVKTALTSDLFCTVFAAGQQHFSITQTQIIAIFNG